MMFNNKQKSLSSDYYLELKSDIYTMVTYARQLGLEIPDDLKKLISILVSDINLEKTVEDGSNKNEIYKNES